MSMTVAEMRQILTEKFDYTEDQLKELGKAKTRELLESLQNATEEIDVAVDEAQGAKDEADVPVETDEDEEVATEAPAMCDVKWTEYVMSHFDEETELEEGNPKTDALRRVALELLGTFSNRTEVVRAAGIDTGERATVVSHITFYEYPGMTKDVIFSGAADTYAGNCEKPFSTHAAATAETRAEGRALRKALFLTKVLTAEEKLEGDPDESDSANKKIPASLLNGLNALAKKNGVDAFKVAIKLGYNNIESLADLTFTQGQEVLKTITDFQQKPELITDEVKADK